MVVEGDKDDRFGNQTQPKRSQIMKIARAVEQKRRGKTRFVFPIKLFDQAWRRGETQLRAPTQCVGNRKAD